MSCGERWLLNAQHLHAGLWQDTTGTTVAQSPCTAPPAPTYKQINYPASSRCQYWGTPSKPICNFDRDLMKDFFLLSLTLPHPKILIRFHCRTAPLVPSSGCRRGTQDTGQGLTAPCQRAQHQSMFWGALEPTEFFKRQKRKKNQRGR